MTVWLIFEVALFAVLASAETAEDPASMGATLLLLPRSGIPVSFEQIEERSPRQDGTSTIIKSKIYRDSPGRVRVEEHKATYVILIDPVAGSRVLLSTEQIAYRTPWPKSCEGKLVFFGIGDGAAAAHNWTARTENIGKRSIEGIEFDGTRIVQTAEGEPRLTKTVEQWYSDELKLIGLAVVFSSNKTYTARIQHLRREEADPMLFAIPPDYKILDLRFPSPDQQ